MFITNELTPTEVLAELLKGRRASSLATERFGALRHDRDLVPRFASNVDVILDVYKAYRTDVHDIQGIRDDGVDVLLRFDREGHSSRVGLQIKSNDEFDQWEKKKLNMVEKLKAQYSAAMENARIDDYYVVICADDIAHRKRIRTVCSELKNYRGCTIIEPRDALGFFDMSDLDLLVRTTRLLCSSDTILRTALDEADAQEPDVVYFLSSLVNHAFQQGLTIDDSYLFNLWYDWKDFVGEDVTTNDRLTIITQNLLSTGIIKYDGSDYLIDVTRLPVPLSALYFDLKVRNLESDGNIDGYMLGLLEIKDRMLS